MYNRRTEMMRVTDDGMMHHVAVDGQMNDSNKMDNP